MPIFEYHCKSCGKRFEFLVRNSNDKVKCDCGSNDIEKLFSSFAVSETNTTATTPNCSNGSCNLPSSPCASGMCGL